MALNLQNGRTANGSEQAWIKRAGALGTILGWPHAYKHARTPVFTLYAFCGGVLLLDCRVSRLY